MCGQWVFGSFFLFFRSMGVDYSFVLDNLLCIILTRPKWQNVRICYWDLICDLDGDFPRNHLDRENIVIAASQTIKIYISRY